jgi:predicted 2-oxoglutarate/Fe(II)-dependent dioxygenase YbiX
MGRMTRHKLSYLSDPRVPPDPLVGMLFASVGAASTFAGAPRTLHQVMIGATLSPDPAPPNTEAVLTALSQEDACFVIPGVASQQECASLIKECMAAAAEQRSTRLAAGLPLTGLTRLYFPPHNPDAQPRAAASLCDVLAERLFQAAPGGLHDLYSQASLEFSCREPAVNVYETDGEFRPHKDQQALTVLINISSPESDFWGGGTGFWSQDARGPRVEAPQLVLRPPAGSALLFGGHVLHTGVAVERGVRVCLVASFSPAGRCGRTEAAARVRRASVGRRVRVWLPEEARCRWVGGKVRRYLELEGLHEVEADDGARIVLDLDGPDLQWEFADGLGERADTAES